MSPIQHPLCNDILKRPSDMTEEECSDLHILRDKDRIYSFWKPDPQELAALNKGEPIVFQCLGTNHPPISIDVLSILNAGEAEAETNQEA
jgi:hypothetical protein